MLLDPVVQHLVLPVSWWLFISGCDELFVDFWFSYYSLFGKDGWNLSISKLDETPEKRIAVFVPMWREFEVIEQMITHNIAAIDYHNYDIFLGTYPNDPRTIERAMILEERFSQVHKSMCPENGPTNKADCLNWIYQRMKLEEEKRGVRYEVIVQHDAEDIIHPKAFKLINRLMQDYDMVQIPVFPLEMPLKCFTHGTYCDEFAEYQLKDIYTRQALGGFVPAAGVGTAFRREALDEIAGHYRNQIYNVNTLTEDYEIGLKFKLHNKRQFLVRQAIPVVGRNGNGQGRNGNGHGNGHGKGNGNGRAGSHQKTFQPSSSQVHTGQEEFIATREYFPDSFRFAVRQKARWVMGVALQGWEQMGWRGPLRQLYWYWRDRKGLLGNLVTMLSNCIFLYGLLMWAGSHVFHNGWKLAAVFPNAGVFWWLIAFNTFFVFERCAYKVYTVGKIYGRRQAAGALLRIPWANLINFASTVYALYTYILAKFLRVEVKWAKTPHAFPTREQLMEYKRRLGELLLENRLISAPQLEHALETQSETEERLGEILIRLSYLTELEFARALGQQQNMEVREVDPYQIDLEALRKLPRQMALENEVMPISVEQGDTLLVVSPGIVSPERLVALEASTGLRVVAILTTRADLEFAQERGYGRLEFEPPPGKVRLGEALVKGGHLGPEQLAEALREQKSTRRPLGEVLLARGWVEEEVLRQILPESGTAAMGANA